MTTTTLARATDPITSKIAGATAKTLTQKQSLLLEFVGKSMTGEEAAERAGLLGVGYWKRVSDLQQEGSITERLQANLPRNHPISRVWSVASQGYAYVVMRLQKSGKHAIVWQITDKGRAEAKAIKAALKS